MNIEEVYYQTVHDLAAHGLSDIEDEFISFIAHVLKRSIPDDHHLYHIAVSDAWNEENERRERQREGV